MAIEENSSQSDDDYDIVKMYNLQTIEENSGTV